MTPKTVFCLVKHLTFQREPKSQNLPVPEATCGHEVYEMKPFGPKCESRSHSALASDLRRPAVTVAELRVWKPGSLRPQAPWRQLLIRALLSDWGLGFWSSAAGKRLRCLPSSPARLSNPNNIVHAQTHMKANMPAHTLCVFTLKECIQSCLQVSHNSEAKRTNIH